MYRQIVVALDGSEFAETIIPYASALAVALGAELTLWQTVDPDHTRSAEAYLQPLAEETGGRASVISKSGGTAGSLLGQLEEVTDSLLAMTTHGWTGLMEALTGSTVSHLLKEASLPVLLLRPFGKSRGLTGPIRIKTVLATLDGEAYSECILPHAAALAEAFDARLKLVQVIDQTVPPDVPDEDVLESSYLHNQAKRVDAQFGLSVDWDVLHGDDPADAIVGHAKDLAPAILVMSSHAYEPLGKTALGSITGECVRHSGMPVLVVGPNAV